ncbi:MAG TPA: serine hydrolase [Firmicutes bacterium]|nr:serine hydrolase [Bacillota bacterium]
MTRSLWKSPSSLKRRRLTALLLSLVLTACAVPGAAALYSFGASPAGSGGEGNARPAAAGVPLPDLPLRSRSALLLSPDTGEVWLEKAADEPADPAALTTVMTVLTALEELDGDDPAAVLPKSLFERLLLRNAPTAGFLPGEEVKASALLYGALLSSGADAAVGLAQAAAGSERAFVERMNRKAEALGMKGTHFTNAAGLYDPEQTTTARDLARLLAAAWDKEAFRAVFTARSALVGPTNRHPAGLRLVNPVYVLAEDAEGVRLLGAKAGASGDAAEGGGCFLGMAEVGGKRLLLVLLGLRSETADNAAARGAVVEEAMRIFAACACPCACPIV